MDEDRTPVSANINLVIRCSWAQNDPLLRAYHDKEWGVPEHGSRALWEMLMLEGFQAGLSWITILRKRAAFRNAFANFVPEEVAQFTEVDIQRLLGNAGIVRSRSKIVATIGGARAYLAMTEAGEDFARFFWNLAGNSAIQQEDPLQTKSPLSEEISIALKKRGFKFVGPTVVYAWMQAAGMVNGHATDCFRHNRLMPR